MASLKYLRPGTGLTQLSSTDIAYQLLSTGAAILTDANLGRPQPVVQATVQVTGTNPILAWRAEDSSLGNGVTLFSVQVSGRTHTYTFRCTSPSPVGLIYWAFDVAAEAGAQMSGPRMQVWKEDGTKTFDSRAFAMDFKGYYENPLEGQTYTLAQPVGKTYAVVQSLYGYIQRNVNLGQYANDANGGRQEELNPDPDAPPAQGSTHYLNRGEGYQPAAKFSGSDIIMGMELFESFESWQPIGGGVPDGLVNRTGSGRAAHTVIDVTNLPSAVMPDENSLAVSANATTREVNTLSAQIINSTTPAVTVTATGGVAPYSYLWQRTAGSNVVNASGPTDTANLQTTSNSQDPGTSREATWVCRATDVNGRVGYSPPIVFRHVITYIDVFPDTPVWNDLTFVTNEVNESTSQVISLTGFNSPVNLRLQRTTYKGPVDGAIIRVYTGPSIGNWTEVGDGFDPRGSASLNVEFTAQPNSFIQLVYGSATSSGRQNYSYNLTLWNDSDTGGPAVLAGPKKIDITVDADNVADFTPDPMTFPNISLSNGDTYAFNEESIGGAFAAFGPTVNGINRTIRLRFECLTNPIAETSSNNFGVYTHGHAGYAAIDNFVAGTFLEFDVSNGATLNAKVNAATASGRARTQSTWRVTNVTTGAVLGNFTVDVTVDNDNNFNIPDYTPDAISIPDIIDSSNSENLTTYNRSFRITGINRPATLRVMRSFASLSGSGNINTRRLFIYRSPTGAAGTWTEYFVGAGNSGNPFPFVDVPVNNGDYFYVNALITTTAGTATSSWTNYIDILDGAGTNVGRLATFQITGTADADNNFNNADQTPDTITFDSLIANSTAHNPQTNSSFRQVTGINQPITLRFTRVHEGVYGAVDSQILYVHHSTTGSGGPWTRYDLGYNGTCDIQVSNGHWLYVTASASTSRGAAGVAWNTNITNVTTGGTAVGSFYSNLQIDTDNNYNIAQSVGWGDVSGAAGVSNTQQAAAGNGYQAISGQATPRTIIHTVVSSSHNFDSGGVQMYKDGSYIGECGLAPGSSFSLANVSSGSQFSWVGYGNTLSGRKSGTFTVHVTTDIGEFIDAFSYTLVADDDNNFNLFVPDSTPDAISMNDGGPAIYNRAFCQRTSNVVTISGINQTITLEADIIMRYQSAKYSGVYVLRNGAIAVSAGFGRSPGVQAQYPQFTVNNGDTLQVRFEISTDETIAGPPIAGESEDAYLDFELYNMSTGGTLLTAFPSYANYDR